MPAAKKAASKKKAVSPKKQEAHPKAAADHPRHPDAELVAVALLILGSGSVMFTQEQLDAAKGKRLVVQQVSSNETLVSME